MILADCGEPFNGCSQDTEGTQSYPKEVNVGQMFGVSCAQAGDPFWMFADAGMLWSGGCCHE